MQTVKFQRRPVIIETILYTGNAENISTLHAWCGAYLDEHADLIIPTLEDGSAQQIKHAAQVGDYIIQGVAGEFYPCKPEIFHQTYIKVD